MKDDNELLIGYRPELQYEDEYVSDIDFNNIDKNDIENNSNKEEIENLIQDMNNLHNLIDKLPNNIAGIIDEIYDQVVDFIEEELFDKELLPVPNEEEWIYDDPIDNNNDNNHYPGGNNSPDNNYPDHDYNPDGNDNKYPDDNHYPDDNDDPSNNDKDPDNNDYDDDTEPTIDDEILWNDDDFFPITPEEHTEEEIIEKEYVKNLVDLFQDYQTNLHTTLSNFWMNFILASNNKTAGEIKLLLNNILLNSSDVQNDAKHLLDSAVRQEIIKTMKFEYYNMMFNAEETIKQLKQFKAVYELRLRYSKIKELDGSTKTNQSNNNILQASKMIYDKKYEIAYENLYRYLSSSNKLLNDSLQTWIQEIKSKQILIERKGINK